MLCGTDDNNEENELIVERHSPLQTGKGNVFSSSEGDSIETLTMLLDDVTVEIFAGFLGYNARGEDENYVQGQSCRFIGLTSESELSTAAYWRKKRGCDR